MTEIKIRAKPKDMKRVKYTLRKCLETLGVSPDDPLIKGLYDGNRKLKDRLETSQIIRDMYLCHIKKNHPDMGGDTKEAQNINEAYRMGMILTRIEKSYHEDAMYHLASHDELELFKPTPQYTGWETWEIVNP